MALIDVKGEGYLFQLKPSIFPEGELGLIECALWELYYHDKESKRAKK